MESKKKYTDFTEEEYKEFFSWLLNKDNIKIEKEVDRSSCLYSENPYIYYTPEIKAFFETEAMKRLGKIGQIANVAINNPNSIHTRLEHCKGAYQKMLDFYMIQYKNPEWREKNSKPKSKLIVLADMIDMASHDIGHNILSHALEKLIGFQKGAHEILGYRILHENEEVVNVLKNIHPNLSLALDYVKADNYNLHTLKEGTIDFDRGDFLVRDSIYLGGEAGLNGEDRKSIVENLTQLMNGCTIYPVTINNKKIEVPVFDYSVEPDIEDFLQKRFENYEYMYISPENKTYDILLEEFCFNLNQNKENVGLQLKRYIKNISKEQIDDINIDEFLSWNDTRFYNQLFDVIEKTKDEGLRNFAITCLPRLESLVSWLYTTQMDLISPEVDEKHVEKNFEFKYEKDFYLRVKSVVNNEFPYSDLIKKQNKRDSYIFMEFNSKKECDDYVSDLEKGLKLEDGSVIKISDNTVKNLNFVNRKIKKYNKNEPIFIKNEDNRIFTFDEYPDRTLDIQNKESYCLIGLFDKLRMAGINGEEIFRLKHLARSLPEEKIQLEKSTRYLSELEEIKLSIEDDFECK